MKIKIITAVLLCIACRPAHAQPASPMHAFPLQQVQLLPGIFYDAQQTDMKYMLALDADRLLAPYLKEAGFTAKKENYGNWENTGLDGHIGGHYLSALSLMWVSTHDARMNQRLDYMLAELKRCQDKIGSGYLGGMPGGISLWKDIAAGKIVSDTFALNGKWVPLYNLHKLLAGLRDAYTIAGKNTAKEILVKLVAYIDKVASHLTDEQIQTMLYSEHGGLNEVFADVAVITGNKEYLTLARRFSHNMILQPLVAGQDKLTGEHANMQIPKAIGFQRIAEVGADTNFAKAARFFWETVVKNRSVVIGGNSVNEHFNPADDFTVMLNSIAGPETCNTYNMLKLTRHLFEADARPAYMAYYERALYNHILSSQHPETGGFVYYTPMRPQHYRVYSQPQLCMWCCVGSGMENHGKYGELIYSYRQQEVYVNLFISSRLRWPAKQLTLTQQSNFPDQETTAFTVDAVQPGNFSICLRYPQWVAAGSLLVKINGTPVTVTAQPGEYVKLQRVWKKGDRIELRLPMKLSTEAMPGSNGYIAFLQGPIVLAAKTDSTDLDNLQADANQFGGYRARGKMYPLDSAPTLLSNETDLAKYLLPVAGKPQTYTAPGIIAPAAFKNLELIPFYKLHDARYMLYWQKKAP